MAGFDSQRQSETATTEDRKPSADLQVLTPENL